MPKVIPSDTGYHVWQNGKWLGHVPALAAIQKLTDTDQVEYAHWNGMLYQSWVCDIVNDSLLFVRET